MRKVWAGMFLVMLLTAGCDRGSHPSQIGAVAPTFAVNDGVHSVDLSKLQGDVVVLNFWATWCAPCIEELPSLMAMQRQLPQIKVLAVSTDTAPTLKQWADQQGWTFPTLSDFWPHGEVAKKYGAFNEEKGCANRVTVVIDKDGKVVDTFQSGGLGEARPADRYTEAMAKL